MLHCKSCGTGIARKASFCTKCGTAMEKPGIPGSPDSKGQAAPRPRIILPGLVVLVITAAVVLGVRHFPQQAFIGVSDSQGDAFEGNVITGNSVDGDGGGYT